MIFLLFTGIGLLCIDYLKISRGPYQKLFCGTTTPASFVVSQNVVTLRMFSNGILQQTGFELNFTTVQSKRYSRCVRERKKKLGPRKTGLIEGKGGDKAHTR